MYCFYCLGKKVITIFIFPITILIKADYLYYLFHLHDCSYIVPFSKYSQTYCYFYRVTFTLEELAPAVPAYTYFRSCLVKINQSHKKQFSFEASQVSTSDLPRCSCYERVKEMVQQFNAP